MLDRTGIFLNEPLPTFKLPSLSIVIVTYNRPKQCGSCLLSLFEAIRAVPDMDCRVVIGINGPDSNTSAMLDKLITDCRDITIKVIPSEKRRTPSAVRNTLLEATGGDWIYFIDDDTVLASDTLLKFIRTLKMKPQSAVLGGPNLTPPYSSLFQRATGVALSSRFGTYFSSVRYVSSGETRNCGEESLILCNMFARRDVIGPNPFLEDLLCCEENWLIRQISKRGFHIVYDPGLIVWHDRRPTLKLLGSQVFKYGYGRGQLIKRGPEQINLIHAIPVACLIYIFITFSIFVTLKSLPNMWFFPFVIYLALCLFVATKKIRLGLSVPTASLSAFLFPVVHLSYGTGLFFGLLTG